MKLGVLFPVVLSFLLSAPLAADESTDFNTEMIVIHGRPAMLDYSSDRLTDLVKNMDSQERNYLFTLHKKENATIGCLLNGIGFGIGSFIQGDNQSGAVILFGDFSGLGISVLGNSLGSGELYYGGLFVVVVFQIASFITPYSYQSRWNRRLGQILDLNQYSFEPGLREPDRIASSGTILRAPLLTARF